MGIKSLITVSMMAVMVQVTPMIFGQDEEQPIGRRRWEQRTANLSPEERQKLQAAQQQAMQDPAVQAARIKMQEARKEFRDARRPRTIISRKRS